MSNIHAALIKRFEGCRLQAYPDPASPLARGEGTDGRPWTVGYGCTGPGIGSGTVWTQEQADQQLEHRLTSVEESVRALVKVPLTDDQLAALCSFEWNTGALHCSTLLRLLNEGDYLSAAGQFLRWNKAQGRVLPGLVTRREAELDLFISDLLPGASDLPVTE